MFLIIMLEADQKRRVACRTLPLLLPLVIRSRAATADALSITCIYVAAVNPASTYQ